MPRTYTFHTLDVFTATAYKGNQLGVVLVPPNNPLSEAEKQSIANEFNYSESIFIHTPPPSPSSKDKNDNDNDNKPPIKVDIFTPESELPFAGHPTIGALNYIFTHIHPDRTKVRVQLKAGIVHGVFDRETGFASAEIPQTYHCHAHRVPWSDVVSAQPGLDAQGQELVREQGHALVSIVAGMNFALVDLSACPELLRHVVATRGVCAAGHDLDQGWPATLVGSLFFVKRKPEQGSDGDGVVRVDQRMVAIGLEDPATGSASCALTAHLAVQMGGKGRTHRFELVQGEQMGRKSVIVTEVTLDASGEKVERLIMRGQCKSVMKGELEI